MSEEMTPVEALSERVAILTAEVERLRGEKAEAVAVASDALHLAWGRLVFGHDDESEDNALQGRLAALALHTNAPEAWDPATETAMDHAIKHAVVRPPAPEATE